MPESTPDPGSEDHLAAQAKALAHPARIRILRLLQRYGVKQCFYGHLHGASHKRALEGIHNGTAFSLVAGDWLDFVPKKICE